MKNKFDAVEFQQKVRKELGEKYFPCCEAFLC